METEARTVEGGLHAAAARPVKLYGREMAANRRMPLNLDWVEEIQVNTSAVERRAATIPARRSVKKEWQAAWLLRAIACMDLTTLSGDDSADRVRRLCAKARRPLQDSIVKGLGIEELQIGSRRGLTVGAVCVYHAFVETAVKALEGSGIPVAAVSTGFPAGLSPLETRVEEIRRSVAAGAGEIDIVITRAHVFNGEWNALYDEVARASWVAMMAGADFIKTSTGKEAVNATLPVSLVMVRALREYGERTGMAVGFKPAGGIKTAKQALDWMATMKDELGRSWLEPSLFRYGASSMLGDIERQLEHFVTGRYSGGYRHPMA
jgi:deoxyribose-phosphate aldolase